MVNRILIHYHEIALKGGNRFLFENQLKANIQKALKELAPNLPKGFDFKVVNARGRILVELLNIKTSDDQKINNIGSSDVKSLDSWTSEVQLLIKNKLQKIFGIANFSFCYGGIFLRLSDDQKININNKSSDNLKFKKEKIIEEIKNHAWNFIKNKKFSSFKIYAKRAEKSFPFDSQQINEIVGAFIQQKSNAKVDLSNPELTCFIEISGKDFFIYDEKIPGAGGLPVGASGKIISLISSGIDSPVASWFLMKRGARITFVHFHSYPQTSLASKENVENIVKILNEWQYESKIYFVPFLEIQKKILLESSENLRVVLYRRQMIKIANIIAGKENALGLITGDSLGQVASQTLENLNTVSAASNLPIYRPLIGMDKEEIINIAKKIGTYEISTKPYEDCCNLFTPAHPATKSSPEEAEKIEKKIKLNKLITKATKEATIIT